MPDAFLPGYAVYLAAVLLPGYGLGELSGKWKGGDGVSRRLGYSLGYGLAVDTAVLGIRTLGPSIGGVTLRGIGPGTLVFLILLGPVFVGASYYRARRLTPLPRPEKSDLWILGCAAFVGAIVALYFAKYPLFPIYYNPDFVANVGRPAQLAAGSSSVFGQILYGSAYYQVAMGFRAVGTANILTAELVMSILVALSPMLFYAVAADLFGASRPAAVATAIYALSGTVWAQMIYSDGLYPNFVGVLIELLLLAVFLDFAKDWRSHPLQLTMGFVVVAGYLSHFTMLALLGALLVATVIVGATRRPGFRGYIVAAAATLAPGALGMLVLQKVASRIILISYLNGPPQPLSTPLSGALSFLPSLAYLASDMRNDLGFVAMLALLLAALYKGAMGRETAIVVPAMWFFALLVAAPQDAAAWRFSLQAVVPLTLLAGYGLHAIMPRQRSTKQKRLRAGDPYKFGVAVLLALFIIPIAAPGWASTFALNMSQGTAAEAQVQSQVGAALSWASSNTPSSAYLLSVTDPTFLYSGVQIGRNCTYEFFGNQSQAIAYAKHVGADYIVVTRYNVFYNPLSAPSNDSTPSLPWFTYKPTSNFTLAFSNPDVKVFKLGG